MGYAKLKPLSIEEIRAKVEICFNCKNSTKEYITWWKCNIAAEDVKICIKCFPKKYRVFKVKE